MTLQLLFIVGTFNCNGNDNDIVIIIVLAMLNVFGHEI